MPRRRAQTLAIEQFLRRLVSTKQWDINQPLPSTRELSRRHKVSSPSVCRLMKRLQQAGVIWQRENGRYYPPESRRIFERRKPYIGLLRSLSQWGRPYHAMMSGFTESFGDTNNALLLVANDSLVRSAAAGHPPMQATLAVQRQALAAFARDYRGQAAGIVCDDAWRDDAIAEVIEHFANAVILGRTSRLPGLSTVTPDFDAIALMAIAHLRARGFEELWIGVPRRSSAPIDLMLAAMLDAATKLGTPIDPKMVFSVAVPADRELLVARLKAAKRRVGFFCPDEHVSLLLCDRFAHARIDCPGRIGLLSAFADIATERDVSCIKIDYEAIGRSAGILLANQERSVVKHPGRLVRGNTS